jgi:integrase
LGGEALMVRANLAGAAVAVDGGYWARLTEVVRPDFRVEVYFPDRADAVLGAGLCRVAVCQALAAKRGWCTTHGRELATATVSEEDFAATARPGPARRRAGTLACTVTGCPNRAGRSQLCGRHRSRWLGHGRPDLAAFVATTAPVAVDGPCLAAGCGRPGASSFGLCTGHARLWQSAGRPELAGFAATVRALAPVEPAYDFSGLPAGVRLELQYALQCRHDDAKARCHPNALVPTVVALRRLAHETTSLLDRPLAEWEPLIDRRWTARSRTTHPLAFLRFACDRLSLLADDSDEFAKDRWDLRRLGLHAPNDNSGRTIRFDDIAQPWLRRAVQHWVRLRLGRLAVTTVTGNAIHLRHFAAFLADRHPEVTRPGLLTRTVIEDYLVFVARPAGEPPATKLVSSLGMFLDDCRRFDWLPLAEAVRVYRDDFAKKPQPLPRALDETVMAQLEDPANLARLADDGTAAVVIIMMRTGLRAGDAVKLPADPLTFDAGGAPYLRFFMTKLRKDHRLPVDDAVVAAVRAQQAHVRFRWPAGSPWLFPRLRANSDGRAHYATCTIQARLRRWIDDCGIVDGAGRPLSLTSHQFRHTLGTRMINQGVPQHVVQELLGHESAEMTAHYARLHDSTLRAAFDAYSRARVDVAGRVVVYNPEGDTAAGEWMKERLGRAKQTLPNGFCGRPLQQECPHPNACLTCPDFLTDVTFVDLHRGQRDRTRTLIATAEASGQFRLVEMNRKVEANLDTIIAALETLEDGDAG